MDRTEILLSGEWSHIGRAVSWALEHRGYRVRVAPEAEDVIAALVTRHYDLLIYIFAPQDSDGVGVIERARKIIPAIKVMLISQGPGGAFPLKAYRMKVDDYLIMPCSSPELYRRVARCLKPLKRIGVNQPAETVEIRATDRLLSIFHDIRGSLVSTAAGLKLVKRGIYGEISDDVTERLREAKAKINKLVGMVEESMNQVLIGHPQKTDCGCWDLRQDIIKPVLEECAEEIRDHEITIVNQVESFPGPTIPVNGSKFFLRSVFRNLLTNAIKYGGQGCTVTVAIKDQGSCYRLQVANTGQPLSRESGARLFRFPHRQKEGVRKLHGLGMGLYLSRNIIKGHGGDIWYEPSSNGSNFVVALPHN